MVSPVAIVDAQYARAEATAACVVASEWGDAVALEERVVRVSPVRPYVPGQFYLRELPCLLEVLSSVQATFRAVVVDGYVDLDERGTPGLGGYLYRQYGGRLAVVGVAKTSYRGAAFAERVTRGASGRPLYVTAQGISAADAARLVAGMHGGHRIPTLLARADRLARGLTEM